MDGTVRHCAGRQRHFFKPDGRLFGVSLRQLEQFDVVHFDTAIPHREVLFDHPAHYELATPQHVIISDKLRNYCIVALNLDVSSEHKHFAAHVQAVVKVASGFSCTKVVELELAIYQNLTSLHVVRGNKYFIGLAGREACR